MLTTALNCVRLSFMGDKQVWRSIRFPATLAEEIERIARRERRSFSSQALLFLEGELAREKGTVAEGQTRREPEAQG